MNADMLLSRLDGVRKCGYGWRANCPNGHTKSRGSLSIMEADDGRILMTCFACQDTHGILAALGLEMADLFPERISAPTPEARRNAREAFRHHAWNSALQVIDRETTVVLIAAHDVADKKPLDLTDHARLLLAARRISDARRVMQ